MFLGNTPNQNPGLFGLKYSNRDFTQKEAWGKNCFNSSFPAALCSYLHSQNLENIYIKLNANLKIENSTISTANFYGIDPDSDNLFFAFETQFTPYQQYLIGTLPGVDLVTQARNIGSCLQAIEIKLTALPDNTTCDLAEDYYGCEIVVRPDTIVYLACSIVDTFRLNPSLISSLIVGNFSSHYPNIAATIKPLLLNTFINKFSPQIRQQTQLGIILNIILCFRQSRPHQ